MFPTWLSSHFLPLTPNTSYFSETSNVSFPGHMLYFSFLDVYFYCKHTCSTKLVLKFRPLRSTSSQLKCFPYFLTLIYFFFYHVNPVLTCILVYGLSVPRYKQLEGRKCVLCTLYFQQYASHIRRLND